METYVSHLKHLLELNLLLGHKFFLVFYKHYNQIFQHNFLKKVNQFLLQLPQQLFLYFPNLELLGIVVI